MAKQTSLSAQVCALAQVILNDRKAATFKGFDDPILMVGATTIVFPVGETEHWWDPIKKIKGPAFRAIILNNDGSADRDGWLSSTSLAGGYIYQDKPKYADWTLSDGRDGAQWWIPTPIGTVTGIRWGLSSLLKDSLEGSDKSWKLRGAVILRVTDKQPGWVGSPLPANTIAVGQLPESLRKEVQPEPTVNVKAFTVQRYWTGSARWATMEDLTKALPDATKAQLEKLETMVFKG